MAESPGSMSENYSCPVDGCEYGQDEHKSLAAVRAHVNADGSDGHEWTDVKPQLQGEDAGDTEEADTTETNEEPDADQAETPESDQEDDHEDDQEDDMGTDAEYQEQHSTSSDNQGDSSTDSSEAAAAGAAAGGAGLIAWMQEGNRVVFVGMFVLAIVLVLVLTGDSSDDQGGTANEAPPEATESAEKAPLPGGAEGQSGGGLK